MPRAGIDWSHMAPVGSGHARLGMNKLTVTSQDKVVTPYLQAVSHHSNWHLVVASCQYLLVI